MFLRIEFQLKVICMRESQEKMFISSIHNRISEANYDMGPEDSPRS